MHLHLFHQASQAHRQGRLAEAERDYRQFLTCQPRHADALHLLGILCHQTDRSAEAAELIGRAVEISPRNPDFLINHGLTLRAAGRYEQALASYERAMLLSPKDLTLQNNLGNLYQELGQYDKAAECYRRVLKVHGRDPDVRQAYCHALLSLGNRQQSAGDFAAAEASYQEALHLAPEDAALHYNLGNALREQGKTAEAATSYQKAVALAPQDADAHNNLGNALRELGQVERAVACYERALALNPQLHHALVHLVHQKQHLCDWDGLEDAIGKIQAWVRTEPRAQVSPFAFLAMPGTTAEEQRACADNWVENRLGELLHSRPHLTQEHNTDRQKLRIGYLSADFRLHPLASLISELIELHHREQFEIHAYSYGPDDASPERERLKYAFDHFHDIRPLPIPEAAQKIKDDGIDILVDLTGFTQGSRTGIVALRPAPIHVSWLGFPGTMGGFHAEGAYQPLFDYLLSDPYITPPSEAASYSEKLALLPHSYQANDRNRPIGGAPLRADYGLPEDAFVFCCFNQSFKITPDVFHTWMEILHAVPGSVLWLLGSQPAASANLRRQAEAAGIDPQRLGFAPRVRMGDHLARHALADLFLDTLPYNAHTTASDALWMCLPVLTCSGRTFASRVAGSLLQSVGLAELVTEDLQAYRETAIALARNPARLAAFRERLQQSSTELPLFDTRRFTAHLETAFLQMWERHAAGLPPATFSVESV